MASDYEKITAINVKELGTKTRSRKTQVSMYSDFTHFVYEILQNADDYGATRVSFKLSNKDLVIEHNGVPFEEKNVRAITNFDESTSKKDFNKTGRFGVGFKSVFAVTATPTIASGQEHFQIYGLYRCRDHPYPSGFSRSSTRITLPFNHEKENPDFVVDPTSAKDAYKRISSRLTGLNMNTLLFTRKIREVKWETSNRSGHYLREDRIDQIARRTTITDGRNVNTYLVFDRTPEWREQKYKPVEIAFSIDDKGQLIAVDDFLYVLFPTTLESHLQFILNGPYRTNPARETIAMEDQFNKRLMKETCVLVEEALLYLRTKGLLTAQTLSVLPNHTDQLKDFFDPIRLAVLKAFTRHELVPTEDNGHASVGNVLQGPARLREVIAKHELPFFSDHKSARWVKGVPPNSRADHFLGDLGIQKWGWDELQEVLQDKYGFGGYSDIEPEDKKWLAARTDAWLQKLYLLLGEAIGRGDCDEWLLNDCCIVRARVGGKETHGRVSKVYFPKKGYKDLPQVKPAILRGKTQKLTEAIEDSLKALGVLQIGEKEGVELILESFYAEDVPQVTKTQHLQHMKLFIKWWQSSERSSISGHKIFRTTGDGELESGDACYLDWPLRKTGLDSLYEHKNCPIDKKSKIWGGYRALADDKFIDFAIDCGVEDRIVFEHQHCHNHRSWKKLWRVGARETNTQIDEDWVIPNLDELLALKNRQVNLVIWEAMCRAHPEHLEARYRPNGTYELRTEPSSLVITLAKAEWIPDKRGAMHKPLSLTRDKLHGDFKFKNSNGWLDEIGFGVEARQANEKYQRTKQTVESIGLTSKVADYFVDATDDQRKVLNKAIEDAITKEQSKRKAARKVETSGVSYGEALEIAFNASGKVLENHSGLIGGSTRNPDRRRSKTAEDIARGIANSGNPEDRVYHSFRKTWKRKNDRVRVQLKEWYGGNCQVCGKTFPARNGENYFEGVYLVSHTAAEWLDRVGNVLCLCPLHSAMFIYGEKDSDLDIIEQILKLKTEAEGGERQLSVRITLCGKTEKIKFTDNHLIDLQEMIKTS